MPDLAKGKASQDCHCPNYVTLCVECANVISCSKGNFECHSQCSNDSD